MHADTADSVIRRAREEDRWILDEAESYALLAASGLPVPRHAVIPLNHAIDLKEIGLGETERVVLKILSADILHKSDVGGVRVVRAETDTVQREAAALVARVRERAPDAHLRGLLVAEAIDFTSDAPGTELLLSVRRDDAFGPVLMIGPGGLLTEWYDRLAHGDAHLLFSAESLDPRAALDTFASHPFGAQALRPSRRFPHPPFDAETLGSFLQGLVTLMTAMEVDGVRPAEIELNPVVAGPSGPVALDAIVRLQGIEAGTRPPRPIARVASLLHPRSAAVFGASANAPNAGRIILGNLKSSEGIEYGHLYAVHPRADRIDGVPCVPDAGSLPETVDLAVVSVPAETAGDVVEALVDSGRARAIILIPGGFAETGHPERARQVQEALARSRGREEGGPVLVGGNCLGIVSKGEYNTFFLPHYKLPFHDATGDDVVCISQSGAYLVSLSSNLDGVIYPRASISYGNEMDLTASDFLEYYLDHEPEPRVFGIYLEGLQPREGERFVRLVRRATREDRAVVVYKAGKTAVGARAAASHTASVAGDYRVARTLLQEAGALVCETLNQFEDALKVLTLLRGRRPRGRRVGVITNAGFECGAASDHLYDLELAAFSESTRGRIAAALPPIAHVDNPIDCTPMTDTEHFVQAVRAMAEAEEVDGLVVSAIPATPALDVLAPDPAGRHRENVFSMHSLPAELGRVFAATSKPMVVAIDSGRLYDPAVLLLERSGVPVYRKIDRATRALDFWVRHGV